MVRSGIRNQRTAIHSNWCFNGNNRSCQRNTFFKERTRFGSDSIFVARFGLNVPVKAFKIIEKIPDKKFSNSSATLQHVPCCPSASLVPYRTTLDFSETKNTSANGRTYVVERHIWRLLCDTDDSSDDLTSGGCTSSFRRRYSYSERGC